MEHPRVGELLTAIRFETGARGALQQFVFKVPAGASAMKGEM
jgi:hypothetical protein